MSAEALEELSSENLPFQLRVLQELNDGQRLHVRGTLISKETRPASEIALRLMTLRGSSLADEQTFALTDVASALERSSLLAAREAYEFVVSASSDGVNEYQLELLWGEDVIPLALKKSGIGGESVPADVPEGLRLGRMSIERLELPCEEKPCQLRYEIEAILENRGASFVDGAMFEVGFLDRSADSETATLESREEIRMTGLNLAPGTKRTIRVVFDEEFELSAAERYRPALRLLR